MRNEAHGAAAAAKPFIRATEVWKLDDAEERLTLSSGLYGDLDAFAAVSRAQSFAHGEGLPGKAWAEARPVVLKGFRGSYFLRAEAAEAAGLSAGVAVPIFEGAALKGVLVFLCGDDAEETIGAIEVWRSAGGADPLTLEDGYFGAAAHFEWISRHTAFPKGSGLPGAAWAEGGAILFRDLGASHRFIRADAAGGAGLTAGLALPLESPAEGVHVLALLSARGAPIARRFEIWERGAGGAFERKEAFEDAGAAESGAVPGDGVLGIDLKTGAPETAEGAPLGDGARASLVALPVHRDGELHQVVVLYL